MGLMKKSCWSSPYAAPGSNPDPAKFTITREEVVDRFLIIEVRYPDCTNFEGNKLLVYKGLTSSKQLLELTGGQLDPHFSNSPTQPNVFARFPPTPEGLFAARMLAHHLSL